MSRKPNRFILLLGIIFCLLAGIVIGRALRYKNSPVLTLIAPLTAQTNQSLEANKNKSKPTSAEDQSAEQFLQPGQIQEEGKNWMKFGDFDLLAANVAFTFTANCADSANVSIPPVKIIPWHPEIFETDEFGIGKNVAVAWEHMGYNGLWIHSGWDFWLERSPATDLQYYLETDSLNEVQPLLEIEHKLNDCFLGSQVSLEQGGQTFGGKVTAAVRVPAVGVAELSKHTMDLVPYLAEVYPESGFAELDPDALLIYFCGRAALDERTDPEAGYWTQTRYVIALQPAD